MLAVLFIVDSQQWFINLAIQLSDNTGYTELQAMYIGLMGAIGIFSLFCAYYKKLQLAGLIFALISYSGLAVARAWGIFIDNAYNEFMVQLLLAEIVSIAAAGFGLYCIYQCERTSQKQLL